MTNRKYKSVGEILARTSSLCTPNVHKQDLFTYKLYEQDSIAQTTTARVSREHLYIQVEVQPKFCMYNKPGGMYKITSCETVEWKMQETFCMYKI